MNVVWPDSLDKTEDLAIFSRIKPHFMLAAIISGHDVSRRIVDIF